MIDTLGEKIHDNRFLRLLRHMLKAGYLEDWKFNTTPSGVPQGALCSAEHKDPYEQCRVMRSAESLALVTAALAIDHCA
jgi:hypothetical protein